MAPGYQLAFYALLIMTASMAGGLAPAMMRFSHRTLHLLMSFVAGLMLGVGLPASDVDCSVMVAGLRVRRGGGGEVGYGTGVGVVEEEAGVVGRGRETVREKERGDMNEMGRDRVGVRGGGVKGNESESVRDGWRVWQ